MLPLLWTGGGEGGRKYCLTKFAFFEKMAGKFKTFKRNCLKQMYFTKEHVLVLISGLLPTLIIILISSFSASSSLLDTVNFDNCCCTTKPQYFHRHHWNHQKVPKYLKGTTALNFQRSEADLFTQILFQFASQVYFCFPSDNIQNLFYDHDHDS